MSRQHFSPQMHNEQIEFSERYYRNSSNYREYTFHNSRGFKDDKHRYSNHRYHWPHFQSGNYGYAERHNPYLPPRNHDYAERNIRRRWQENSFRCVEYDYGNESEFFEANNKGDEGDEHPRKSGNNEAIQTSRDKNKSCEPLSQSTLQKKETEVQNVNDVSNGSPEDVKELKKSVKPLKPKVSGSVLQPLIDKARKADAVRKSIKLQTNSGRNSQVNSTSDIILKNDCQVTAQSKRTIPVYKSLISNLDKSLIARFINDSCSRQERAKLDMIFKASLKKKNISSHKLSSDRSLLQGTHVTKNDTSSGVSVDSSQSLNDSTEFTKVCNSSKICDTLPEKTVITNKNKSSSNIEKSVSDAASRHAKNSVTSIKMSGSLNKKLLLQEKTELSDHITEKEKHPTKKPLRKPSDKSKNTDLSQTVGRHTGEKSNISPRRKKCSKSQVAQTAFQDISSQISDLSIIKMCFIPDTQKQAAANRISSENSADDVIEINSTAEINAKFSCRENSKRIQDNLISESHSITLSTLLHSEGVPMSNDTAADLNKNIDNSPLATKSLAMNSSLNLAEGLLEISKQEDELLKEKAEIEKKIFSFMAQIQELKFKKNQVEEKKKELRKQKLQMLHALKSLSKSRVNRCENTDDRISENLELGLSAKKVDETNGTKSIPCAETSEASLKVNSELCGENLPATSAEVNTSSMFNKKSFEVHESSILCIEVFESYVYTGSSDRSAKRFHIMDIQEVISYNGHDDSVVALHVNRITKGETFLFTVSLNRLNVYVAETAVLFKNLKLKYRINCMCGRWDTVFLGTENGKLVTFSIIAKDTEEFYVASCSLLSISTTSQGSQRLLCILSSDGLITVWDASSQLLLKCLNQQFKSPSKICNNGDYLFVTTKSGFLHAFEFYVDFQSCSISCCSSPSDMKIIDNYPTVGCVDGAVRYFKKNDIGWYLYSTYKVEDDRSKSILCLAEYQLWILVGNSAGEVKIFHLSDLNQAISV